MWQGPDFMNFDMPNAAESIEVEKVKKALKSTPYFL